MTDDPRWPRAAAWLAESTARLVAAGAAARPDVVLLGVPAHRTSLSATRADRTPAAVRAALVRFSPWSGSTGLDLTTVATLDLGDVDDPDGPGGEDRTREHAGRFPDALLVALGGDNSVTVAVAQGRGATGLVTLDAHHDLRDGRSNGSPVRRLIADGLDGTRVVQVGIADFANSRDYAARARDLGITVVARDALDRRPIEDVMAEALEIAGGGDPSARIHVDLDVDVCDRSVAPACPASVPGGISAAQLRAAARAAGADPRVASIDLVEVDATADTPDGRTVRLVALCVLEACTGLLART